MNCFSCFQCHGSTEEDASPHAEHEKINKCYEHAFPHNSLTPENASKSLSGIIFVNAKDHKKQKAGGNAKTKKDHIEHGDISSQYYTFRELASATKNFRQECLLGEGGFGRVYKGTLPCTGQVVAVKQLDRHGLQGNQEFLAEVMAMSQLHHENLVKLIGYCADGDQRLLVHEYLSGGSLEDHLFDIGTDKRPLDWVTRMRIAFGAAQGLEYLHNKADPPVIYRDLKSSNILMDSDYNPKLSDFGFAKLGPSNNKMHVSSRVMETYGYCAPEYARTGQLTVKSDIYSFGVVLLELITGRKAIDNKRPTQEQNLVTWAQPKFRDPKSFPDMMDPVLERRFPEKGLNQVVAIAAMCLQEEASVRPLIGDVVATLGFLMVAPPDPMPEPVPALIQDSLPSQKEDGTGKKCQDSGDESDTDSHSWGDSDVEEGRRSKKDHKDTSHDEEGKHNSSSDDEEEIDFKNLVAEEKEYDSEGSSSMISFSLGGSLLSRDKSSESCLQSISSNRQVSMAFSEESVSSRHGIGKEWSRMSSRRSKGKSGRLSPRRSLSSSIHRSSYSSHDEIDLMTPKGSIASSVHKSATLSSRDRSCVLGRGSSVKSRDGNDSSPRSSIEHGYGYYFGHDATEGSKGSSSEGEEVESQK